MPFRLEKIIRYGGVEFGPELGSRSLLRPGAVPASPGPCLVAAWRIGDYMAGIGGNNRSVPDCAATDRRTAGIVPVPEVGPEDVRHSSVDRSEIVTGYPRK